jgi:DNA polymerase-3 subunit beta
LFAFKDSKLTLVATDGRRLALVENQISYPEGQEREAILPTKAVGELRRLLGEVGEVTIKLTQNQAAFEVNDTLIISKLIDGTYPNYRQVIPSEYKQRLELKCSEMLETIRRVSSLVDKNNNVKLTFSTDQLEVASLSDDGEAHETLSIDYKGPQLPISFNASFLMAPLKAVATDSISFCLTDSMSPGVLRLGSEFLYVLMPMRSN